jgi:hypothetical protein
MHHISGGEFFSLSHALGTAGEKCNLRRLSNLVLAFTPGEDG